MPPDGLTAAQRAALLQAIAPFAAVVERVDLFGSRARGTHRPGSDIDLVIAETGDSAAYLRLLAAIDDSAVSVPVDVIRYRDLTGGPMEETLRRDARPLFTQAELRAAVV